jgi:hypothetical protein
VALVELLRLVSTEDADDCRRGSEEVVHEAGAIVPEPPVTRIRRLEDALDR